MVNITPFMMFGAFIAIAVVVMVTSVIRSKKRRQDMQALAESMGFAFRQNGEAGEMAALSSFKLFSRGRSRRMYNVMEGVANDINLRIFDYKFTTGSGKNSHTYRQTVIAFDAGELRLPRFTMTPANIFNKIGTFFGYQDINFTSHPVFSKKYLLRGADEEEIKSRFTSDLLGKLQETKGLSLEGYGELLVMYRKAKTVPASGLAGLMAEGFGVFTLFRSTGAPRLRI